MRVFRLAVLLCAAAVLSIPVRAADDAVTVKEAPLVVPTYPAADPDPSPLFFEGRTYQGARGPIYPYPIIDKLFETKQDRTYKAVWLENEYVRICVLPEMGGRIFEAVDKTNGYNFFYRQHVIKPALIGMLGAWISGGVEWNIPHHHRASSFLPVAYRIEEGADGSKTIWVGETGTAPPHALGHGPDATPREGVHRSDAAPVQPYAGDELVPVLRQRRSPYQPQLPGDLPAERAVGHAALQGRVLELAGIPPELRRRGFQQRRGRLLVQEPPQPDIDVRLRMQRGLPGRLRPRQERRHAARRRSRHHAREEVFHLGKWRRRQDVGQPADRRRRRLPGTDGGRLLR